MLSFKLVGVYRKNALVAALVAVLSIPALTLAPPRVRIANYTHSLLTFWLGGAQSDRHLEDGTVDMVSPNQNTELSGREIDHFFRRFPIVYVTISQGPRMYPILLPARAMYFDISVQEEADGRLQFKLQEINI